MTQDNLATYLNDHLAGSVVALELLKYLEQKHAGSALAATLAEVHGEIADDRTALEQLMAQLNIAQSGPRQATTWLAEKAARFKLAVDNHGDEAMRLFEGLEAISLGIAGKGGLWRALQAAATRKPALATLNYAELIERAERQRTRIEAERLAVAERALAA